MKCPVHGCGEDSKAIAPFRMALLYVDIDNFRYIPSSRPYYADRYYQGQRRLVALTRPKGKVYHLSEDKFCVLFAIPTVRDG